MPQTVFNSILYVYFKHLIVFTMHTAEMYLSECSRKTEYMQMNQFASFVLPRRCWTQAHFMHVNAIQHIKQESQENFFPGNPGDSVSSPL